MIKRSRHKKTRLGCTVVRHHCGRRQCRGPGSTLMYQGFPDSLATPFSTTAPRNPSFTPACDVAVRLMVHAGSRIYRPPRARRLSVGLVRAARRPTRTVRSFSVAGSLTARRTGSSHRHSRHEHHESPTYNFSHGARRSFSSRGRGNSRENT